MEKHTIQSAPLGAELPSELTHRHTLAPIALPCLNTLVHTGAHFGCQRSRRQIDTKSLYFPPPGKRRPTIDIINLDRSMDQMAKAKKLLGTIAPERIAVVAPFALSSATEAQLVETLGSDYLVFKRYKPGTMSNPVSGKWALKLPMILILIGDGARHAHAEAKKLAIACIHIADTHVRDTDTAPQLRVCLNTASQSANAYALSYLLNCAPLAQPALHTYRV